LRSKRIPCDGLTKKQAHDLIDTIYNGATEGQVRRLKFYGINSDGLSKKEAAVIIDEYIANHPDAENDTAGCEIGVNPFDAICGDPSAILLLPCGGQ
jgi:hypothetical protein